MQGVGIFTEITVLGEVCYPLIFSCLFGCNFFYSGYLRTCWIHVVYTHLKGNLSMSNFFLATTPLDWNVMITMVENTFLWQRNDDLITWDGGMQQHLWEKQTTDCAVSCPRLPPSASATSLSLFKIFNQNFGIYRVSQKNALSKCCCWTHSALAQSPVADTPCVWKSIYWSFLTKT